MAISLRWTPGQLVGDRYRIERFLAEGGVGEVYSGQNVWTGRQVAIKRLLPKLQSDATVVERFLLEGRIGGRIEHPNIVQVLDMGREQADDSLFIVQELLRGDSLREVITKRRRLLVREALDIIVPLLGALVAVHQQGVVHRDIKPENIFVLSAPFGQRVPKLLDFGIAKVSVGHTLTERGSVMGTMGYMPPEQIAGAGEVDRRADIWSMGIVMFELLSGAHPFEGDSFAVAALKILHREPRELHDIVPNCSKGLSDIVHKALRKNRQERQESSLAMLEELLRWSRQDSDEFSRALVNRHRMSIPCSLEQKLLAADDTSAASQPALSLYSPSSASEDIEVEIDDSPAPPPSQEKEVALTRQRADDGPTLLEPLPPIMEGDEALAATQAAPAVEIAPQSIGRFVRTNSYPALASEAWGRNDFQLAINMAQLAARSGGGDVAMRVKMHLLHSRASFWLGDPKTQQEQALAAWNLASPESAFRFQAAGELANALSALGSLDSLLQLTEALTQVEVEQDVAPDYLVACCRLATALQRAGWPEHVERVLGRVQEPLHSQADTNAEVRAWTLLIRAELADHAGDHAHSLAMARDAARAFADHGERRWACVCNGSMARAILLLGGYQEARLELGKAIEEATKMRLAHVASLRLNLGLAEIRGGESEGGIVRLRSCLTELEESGDWQTRSTGHRYLAEGLCLVEETDEAEQQARRAVDLAQPSPALRAQALAMLAQVQLIRSRPMEAFMASSQATDILSSVGGVSEDEARIRLTYAMSLSAMGHTSNALAAFGGAERRLLARAKRISDPRWRESFLKNVRDHERTLVLAEHARPDEPPPSDGWD